LQIFKKWAKNGVKNEYERMTTRNTTKIADFSRKLGKRLQKDCKKIAKRLQKDCKKIANLGERL
jgi:hypothetical protein